MSLSRQIQAYLTAIKVQGYSPETIRQYRHDLELFARFIGREDSAGIQAPDIYNFLSHLSDERGYKAASLARKVASLKSFYGWLLENDFVDKNPVAKIKMPKLSKKMPVYLTKEEIKRLLEAAEDPRDRLIIQLLYTTGIRVSELVRIKYADIDFEQGTIKILGKGSKERIVLVDPATLDKVKSYIKFMITTVGKLFDVSTRTVERIVKKAAEKAGIQKHVTPHKLRHTFGTHLYHATKDLRAVQKLMGHSKPETTAIYTHLELEDLKQTYAKVF